MSKNQRTNLFLWTAQVLLAALFLMAGVSKFTLPLEVLMQGPVRLPLGFLRFIGAAEIAGAIGLILPGLLHIRPSLTPFAALGLVTIMTGATVISIEAGAAAWALFPLTVGVIAASIAYGRRGWAPIAS